MITGEFFVASRVESGRDTYRAFDAATGATLEPAFQITPGAALDRACEAASRAFDAFRGASLEQRAALLEGIAAHIANAGIPVLLLDIVPKDGSNRNAVAEGAIQRLLKTDPAPFMHAGAARLVTPGNIEDHLDRLGECDWIVEVVAENIEIKQGVYRKIEEHRKKGSIVSSNTSTIPISTLAAELPTERAARFIGTHYFSPVSRMKLVEVIPGFDTAEATIATATWTERRRLFWSAGTSGSAVEGIVVAYHIITSATGRATSARIRCR